MANTTKKRATELEKEIAAALAAYPDPMSRIDFRKACHIGPRTSIYLLQSGLVPCHNTGKRTRCYRIAKADVSDYLRRRAADPARYTPPSGWYKNYPNHKSPENALVRRLDLTGPRRKKLRSRLAKQLAKAPDVLTLHQICDITGYNRHTVGRWCTEGRLKPIMKTPTFRVPKVWLLDFLCSDDYNNICRKSRKRNQMVREMQEL